MNLAQATVEIRTLIENNNFELFDFDYQVDDLSFKSDIEQKILDFYFDYEIGFETPDMFKRKFKARFLRTISYYNKLYNTTLLSYNPLINSKITEALDQLATTATTQTTDVNSNTDQDTTDNNTMTNNLSNTANGTTGTNSNTKSSDYPQQSISGGDFLNGEQVLDSDTTSNNTTTSTGTVGSVGTGTNDITNTTLGTNTDNGTVNTDYTKTIEGLTGITYQDLIQKERELILRIPNMIIEELKPCFILVH